MCVIKITMKSLDCFCFLYCTYLLIDNEQLRRSMKDCSERVLVKLSKVSLTREL